MKKVLVTGGAGFIGREVNRVLREVNLTPVLFDRRQAGLALYEEALYGDIRDATMVNTAVAQVDGVIHLAGVLGTQETVANPRPAFEVNVTGALNVFEAVVEHGIPCVNICVGNYFMDNPYAISKSITERMAKFYNKDRGARIVNVRAYNAYGPEQSLPFPWGPSKIRKILPSMVGAVLNGEAITVYGNGEQIMDMVHVNDVARILVAALSEADKVESVTDWPVFEAGSGVATTVNDIAVLVLNTLDFEGRSSIIHVPMRPGEEPNAVVLADISTLEMIGPFDLIQPEVGIPAVSRSYEIERRYERVP